ncbi:hypothetical protein NC653_018030 [Populus alba x Populus x berolinensis]|uniref:PPIase cyclophilin-type domain-containing protein n=1 Tax=Populus alba x Populus x berolinensis TaxID=444605 RepID=A0AAD6QS81_9ROSI|nr:hypothetical protein NC653_018030 [Populus alba x Populus x berolinensis]
MATICFSLSRYALAANQGGESIYRTFLVACANAGRPHSNGSQFFITLERFDWLDKKNTIFGKITGDSIFNLLSLGEAETNKNDDWPLDPPPRITSVENPFEDIIPKVPSKSSIEPETETENKDSKKKAEKKLNLLSFGEKLKKRRISWQPLSKRPRNSSEGETTRDVQLSVKEALSSKKGTLSMKEAPGSKKEAPRRDF